MARNPYRHRIRVLVDIINEIINLGESIDRRGVVEIVRKRYDKHGLKPIKGKSNPDDIYDKELSSIYVIGKYGLGIDNEYPELFNKIFFVEKVLEECVELLISGKYSEARELLKTISSSSVIDSNTLARMLRIPFTKLLFGFTSEEEFSNILKKSIDVFPEEARTVRNYVKFYIAFKTADMIYRGMIRDKSYKEAYKKALSLRTGFPRVVPDDKYIFTIASEIFSIPKDVLNKVLNIKNGGER